MKFNFRKNTKPIWAIGVMLNYSKNYSIVRIQLLTHTIYIHIKQ